MDGELYTEQNTQLFISKSHCEQIKNTNEKSLNIFFGFKENENEKKYLEKLTINCGQDKEDLLVQFLVFDIDTQQINENSVNILDFELKICFIDKIFIDGSISFSQQRNMFILDQINYIYMKNIKVFDNKHDKSPIIIKNSRNVEILNSIFHNNENSLDEGGALYLKKIQSVVFDNVTVSENYSFLSGGGIELVNIHNFSFLNSNVTNNVAHGLQGGGVEMTNITNIEIDNCLVEGNRAVDIDFSQGGGLFINFGANLSIKKSNFSQNICNDEGGALLIDNSEIVNLEENIFEQNEARNHGGGIFLYRIENAKIKKQVFRNNTVGIKGGGFYGKNITKIICEESQFLENLTKMQDGAGFYIKFSKELIFRFLKFINNISNRFAGGPCIDYMSEGDTLVFHDVLMVNNSAVKGGGGMELWDIYHGEFYNVEARDNYGDRGGSIYYDHCQNLSFKNMTFSNNTAQIGGALFQNVNKNVNLTDISFFNNTGKYFAGGLKVQDTQNMNIQNLTFISGNSYGDGGGIDFENSVNISMKDLTFQNNSASKGGGLSFQKGTNISLQDSLFEGNEGKLSSGGLRLELIENLKLDNITGKNNSIYTENGGFMALRSSNNIEFSNSEFKNNKASQKGGGVSIQACNNLTLEKLEFRDNLANKAGALYLNLVENVTLINSNILENSAIYSGGIHIENGKNCSLKGNKINHNQVKLMTGGLSFYQCQTVNISKCEFIGNSGSQQGGGIFSNGIDDFNISDSVIMGNNKNCLQGGGIMLLSGERVGISNTVFEKNECMSGAGIYVYQSNLLELSIKNSTFQGNNAHISGGGIVFSICKSILIENSVIQGNSAREFGGGLFMLAVNSIEIQNTEIKDQKNSVKGGGIYSKNIDIFKLSNSKILSNTGKDQGGGIFIENGNIVEIMDTYISKNEVFMEESVGGGLYAHNINKMNIQKTQISQNSADLKGGGIFCLNCQMVDLREGSIQENKVIFDRNIEISQKGVGYILSQGGGIYYESSQVENYFKIQNTQFIVNEGSSGSSMFIYQKINSNIDIEINSCSFRQNYGDIGVIRFLGLEEKELKIKEKMKNITEKENVNLIQPNSFFFGYSQNERILHEQTMQYTICQPDLYLEEGGKQFCEHCNFNGVCEGGYIPIYPKKGYWRHSHQPYQIYHCEKYEKACAGNDTCTLGYTGVLCESCDYLQQYAKTLGNKECGKCDHIVWVIVKILAFSFGYLGLILISMKGINTRVDQRLKKMFCNKVWDLPFMKENQIPGIMKILIMHLQVLFIILTLDIKFQFDINTMSQIIGNPQNSLSTSLECLFTDVFQDIKGYRALTSLYGFFISLGIYGVLVLLIVIGYFCKLVTLYNVKGIFIQSFICFFITTQPGYIFAAIEFLTCKSVGEQRYTLADINIECQGEIYNTFVFPICGILIFIIGFLIPVFIFVQIYILQKKKCLYKIRNQRSYGIFFLEYRDKFYFWEFVAMFLKLNITVISNVFHKQVIVQGCFMLIAIITYFMCVVKFKPFVNKKLNDLSSVGSFTQGMTIFFGICLLDEKIKESQFFVVVSHSLILLGNAVFLIIIFYVAIPEFFQRFLASVSNKHQSKFRFLRKHQKAMQRKMAAQRRWVLLRRGVKQFTSQKPSKMNEIKTECLFYFIVQKEFGMFKNTCVQQQDSVLDNSVFNLSRRQSNVHIQSPINPNLKLSNSQSKGGVSPLLHFTLKSSVPQQQQQQQQQQQNQNRRDSDALSPVPTTLSQFSQAFSPNQCESFRDYYDKQKNNNNNENGSDSPSGKSKSPMFQRLQNKKRDSYFKRKADNFYVQNEPNDNIFNFKNINENDREPSQAIEATESQNTTTIMDNSMQKLNSSPKRREELLNSFEQLPVVQNLPNSKHFRMIKDLRLDQDDQSSFDLQSQNSPYILNTTVGNQLIPKYQQQLQQQRFFEEKDEIVQDEICEEQEEEIRQKQQSIVSSFDYEKASIYTLKAERKQSKESFTYSSFNDRKLSSNISFEYSEEGQKYQNTQQYQEQSSNSQCSNNSSMENQKNQNEEEIGDISFHQNKSHETAKKSVFSLGDVGGRKKSSFLNHKLSLPSTNASTLPRFSNISQLSSNQYIEEKDPEEEQEQEQVSEQKEKEECQD